MSELPLNFGADQIQRRSIYRSTRPDPAHSSFISKADHISNSPRPIALTT
jgi:hypothetical protein